MTSLRRKKVFLAGLTLVVVGCLVCLTANGVVQLCGVRPSPASVPPP
ncbi:hypothetical protein [Streptomyces flavovirens]